MREDMFKVIVERPRLLKSTAYCSDGRRYRNQEDTPMRLGMKKGYGSTKWLNENLAPLKRFLEKQVGRPWDKVYGEIRAVIDPRSTVKQHILQHLEQFVSIHTRWVENGRSGEVWVGARYGEDVTLSDSRAELYVHPRTGILLRNRHYKSWTDKRRESHAVEQQQVGERRRVISDSIQLLLLDGLWYEVELGVLPAPRELPRGAIDKSKVKLVHDARWDCVENRMFSLNPHSPQDRQSGQSRWRLYGDERLHAKSKRQLSAKELKRHGIANKALSGLISFLRGGAFRYRHILRQGA